MDAAPQVHSHHVFVIEGERHAFVHLLSDCIHRLEPRRFCAFRVPHPLLDEGHVIIGGSSRDDAARCLERASQQLVGEVDAACAALGLPTGEAHEPPASVVQRPRVRGVA